jgi:hypothetical protein
VRYLESRLIKMAQDARRANPKYYPGRMLSLRLSLTALA